VIKVEFPETGQVRPAHHGIGQLLSKRTDSRWGHSLSPRGYETMGHTGPSQAQNLACFPGKDKTYFPHIFRKHVDKDTHCGLAEEFRSRAICSKAKRTSASSDREPALWCAQPTAVNPVLKPNPPGKRDRYVGGVTPPSEIALLVGNASQSVLGSQMVISLGTRVVLGRRPAAGLHPGQAA
jgi:hypothetical protein